MVHFHLRVIKGGESSVNYDSRFRTLADASDAAGLANATREGEEGFYDILQCDAPTCERRKLPRRLIVQRQ